MGKPSVPAAPDPTATIAAQTAANSQSALQTAELNRISQSTPWGSSNYSITGKYPDGTPMYSQTTSLAPAQQQELNIANQGGIALGNTALSQLGNVSNTLGQPINASGIPQITGSVTNPAGTPGLTGSINTNGLPAIQSQIGNGDYASQIQQAQNAAYGAQTQYLDPQFKNQQDELNNSLTNQGIAQGSDAWNKAQQQLSLQKQSAYQGAQDAAVSAGNQEQNTLFGQQATSGAFTNAAQAQGFGQAGQQAAFGNSANQQGFGEGLNQAQLQNQASPAALQQLFALRSQPLNEYNALMTGTQVSSPQFNNYPTSNVATTDVGGITNSAYQDQLAAYNAQQAASPWNSLFQLGGSLGSAAILGSDRRLKRDIVRVGQTSSGIPTYTFRYRDGMGPQGEYYGVMADEARKIIPEAVIEHESGYLMVDYSRIPE